METQRRAVGETETTAPIITARTARRRAAMIEAATEVFREHGFASASLDMVIERSGGSRRTLYEQFGNKEGLFVATIETLLEQLISQLSPLALGSDDVEGDLTRAGTAFLQVLMTEDIVAVCRMVVAEMQRFPDLGRRFFEAGPQRAHAAVAAYLEQQTRAGHLRVEEPQLAARQLVEMLKGDLHLRCLLCNAEPPSTQEIEAHVRAAVRTFLYGVNA